jgi:hypothetical protein
LRYEISQQEEAWACIVPERWATTGVTQREGETGVDAGHSREEDKEDEGHLAKAVDSGKMLVQLKPGLVNGAANCNCMLLHWFNGVMA